MTERMKLLHLPLKAEWYRMIESGVKTEEYRSEKPYWRKRLMRCAKFFDWCNDGGSCQTCSAYKKNQFRDYTHVCFRYGYTSRTMTFEIKDITIGMGKYEWGAPTERNVFIIKLGNRIK